MSTAQNAMIEVPVYVPSLRGDGRERRMGGALLSTVAPRSAIVGSGEDSEPGVLPEMIVVYYEGNLFNAVNMVTFADRAMHAYYRMRDHYPTIAMMAVPRSQVVRAATLYPEHGRIEVANTREMLRVCHWLGIDIIDGEDPMSRLAAELRTSGTR